MIKEKFDLEVVEHINEMLKYEIYRKYTKIFSEGEDLDDYK